MHLWVSLYNNIKPCLFLIWSKQLWTCSLLSLITRTGHTDVLLLPHQSSLYIESRWQVNALCPLCLYISVWWQRVIYNWYTNYPDRTNRHSCQAYRRLRESSALQTENPILLQYCVTFYGQKPGWKLIICLKTIGQLSKVNVCENIRDKTAFIRSKVKHQIHNVCVWICVWIKTADNNTDQVIS